MNPKSKKQILLDAADQCRTIQHTYLQQARGCSRNDIKDFLETCAVGAGVCAADIEALAGLSLVEICKRASAPYQSQRRPKHKKKKV